MWVDSARYIKMLERNRALQYLASLNKELDEVSGWILGKDPLLSIQATFSKVRREESRRQVMMGYSTPSMVAENSALIMTAEINSSANAVQHNQRKGDDKGKVVWFLQ